MFEEFGCPRVAQKSYLRVNSPQIDLNQIQYDYMFTYVLKSIVHNCGVLIVSFAVAYLGIAIDNLFGARNFSSAPFGLVGSLLLGLGFFIRTWAAYHFYKHGMKVVALETQSTLITSGPYKFSRNPLYVGGNVFMFFGAGMALGSLSALVLTALHLPLMDRFIRREEKQLSEKFGEEWLAYKKQTRRWL
jgi:protein-S-isoprenylcysteine O-methyltransferase Ste14